jgi:hypothetical protein
MADRFSDPDGYVGERHKGKRIGSIWWSETWGEGDVTVSEYFDDLDPFAKIEALNDVIAMLQRQYDVSYREFIEGLKGVVK